ncbi:YHS domain-containing protein [Chitinophaga nivalis]|uniref:YHS domain-containing protein n=1 Tax=Chitinophaga nivalis TaxID=2991709 RepID=A0ABT3IJ68_9BACT|nr:YHS domain-containing protein [Chitinophaga nivalis]MCW3466303.1 YHS domain-containing protein [Chitinophaga nivalis]MCW3484006.1 YHS domain-containing protein [Chitinophaga nivalis]
MKRIAILMIGIALAAACNNQPKTVEKEAEGHAMHHEEAERATIDTALVANKKDPVCRMPVRLGIYDTARYQQKVLGFCSTACKDSFLLRPENYELVWKQ